MILWRFPKEFSPAFDRSSKPDRVILAWKYKSENGLPNRVDYQRMNMMEDALDSACCSDDLAILALVSTGEDLREWTFYTNSKDEFLARLNLALVGSEPVFPIEIHTAYDPGWSLYERSGLA